MIRKTLWIGLFALWLCSDLAIAEELTLERVQLQLEHPANGSLLKLPGQPYLLVSGFNQYQRWLSLINTVDFTVTQLEIPAAAQFFSKATLAGFEQPQLVFWGIDGLYQMRLPDGQYQRLLELNSVHRVLDPVRLRQRNFTLDLGGELTDFFIPDFTESYLLRQQADGSFRQYRLQLPSRIQSWQSSLDYQPRRPFVLDSNGSGRQDLVVVEDGRFWAFLQADDGSFSEQPTALDWPVPLSTERTLDQRIDAGRSYQGLQLDRLFDVQDMNGDGIPDLVMVRELLADALERNNEYRIHFGRMTEQGLVFQAEPDTRVKTDNVPIDVVIGDFNGNGRQDFYIPNTNIGVGTIVRVLLRGNANLDVDFFLMNEQGRYASRADLRQQARVDVSISNVRFDLPLFQLADLAGTGQKHLLVGESGRLRLYSPDSGRLFSRRSERLELDVPRDSSRVLITDLTGNGKDDLVLPFDAQDKSEHRNQLHLIFSR
ncbi:FG-GAP repeat domain-containing protein [Alkalimonas mucilaginosa]|uniref:VCBS repeat-containing protein n=1 Tax=Alkalimonas mucilaginosa TaxID=3057676 RepID=A0ABU7JBB2_9GAMM|nr:VCBS repeat-containing protein [Alkalimonas sp. MEB004]MEE2022982.1 VCBS repeat-containing protein [Alkalimonas sp. MEB004]